MVGAVFFGTGGSTVEVASGSGHTQRRYIVTSELVSKTSLALHTSAMSFAGMSRTRKGSIRSRKISQGFPSLGTGTVASLVVSRTSVDSVIEEMSLCSANCNPTNCLSKNVPKSET